MNPLVQELNGVVKDNARLNKRPLGVVLRYLQLQPLIQLMDDALRVMDRYEAVGCSQQLVDELDRICSRQKIVEAYDQGWNRAMNYGLSKCCEAAQKDSIPGSGT